MPTYAQRTDLVAYVPGLVIDDVAGADNLLERAERDVDDLLGPRAPRLDTGLKLDPLALVPFERKALERAVCAQAEYLLSKAPDELAAGTLKQSVSGPDFSVTYAGAGTAGTGRIGPRVAGELRPINHLRVLTARPGPRRAVDVLHPYNTD